MSPSAESTGSQAPAGKSDSFGFGAGDLIALSSPPQFTNVDEERAYLKEKLVAALRIFGKRQYDVGVAGHLTVRDPGDPHSFWVNPFGLAFSLMTVSDLILVNSQGDVIGGGKPGRRVVNLAGFTIHSAIHKARPEVRAICHSHSPSGKAYSTLGEPLGLTTQDSCIFYNDCALLGEFGGVVVKGKEGALIAETLADKRSIILQNHGILTVGETIDSAVLRFIMLETECGVQLASRAAGKPIPIDKEQAEFTFNEVGNERAAYFQASPYFQLIEREKAEYIL